MRKKPPTLFVKEDPLLIATNRLIMTIGSSRYALDISTRCLELKPSRAEVIPIDGHFKKGQRKTDVVTEPRQQRGWKASIISPPRGTETIF
jgi:hypothetical protein